MIRIFILFFLVCINSYSQQWEKEFVSQMLPVDSVIMEIQYSVRFICSKTWVISTDAIKKDTLLLQVGSKSSYSYFYTEKQIDVTTEREFQSYGNRNPRFFQRNWACFGDVYNNYPEGKQTVLTYMDMDGTYKHNENIPNFDWEVGSDSKIIMGYKCSNAYCTFRGRKYEAWFANDIPVKFGPWKFCGLPGLILEIYDTDKEFAFYCIGLQKRNNKAMYFWNRKYKEDTREKVRKTQLRYLRHPGSFALDHGVNLFMGSFFGTALDNEVGYPANLIEKE